MTADSISDARGAFLTHSNYIGALDWAMATQYHPGDKWHLIKKHDLVLEGITKAAKASMRYASLTLDPSMDKDTVIKSLKNAWGCEFLLATTGQFATDEILGLANNWAVVQTYYAIYHAMQGLIVAKGNPRPTSHPSTQRQCADFWLAKKVGLPPWSMSHGTSGCQNAPTGVQIKKVKPWKACDDESCWDLVSMAFRTTREDALKAGIKNARKERQSDVRKAWAKVEAVRLSQGKKARAEPKHPLPQLSPTDKQAIDEKLRPASIMDYLYRLRIRSQYVDTAMFTEGPETYVESGSVHMALCHITSATLLVHELMIGKLIGTQSLTAALNEWEKSAGAVVTKTGVRTRRPLIT